MASLAFPCPKCSSPSTPFLAPSPSHLLPPSIASFPNRSPFPRHGRRHPSVTKVQTQLGEVAVKESSNSIPKLDASIKEDIAPALVPDAAAINAFISQVSDLVKLVDSKDIVELQLKQQDCELLIRKKDAILLPPAPQPSYYATPPPPPQQQAPAPVPPSSVPASLARALPAPAATPAKPSASSHPPLKCPMAGTFYRCPGPGEPPFVKVGDKVQKGQVICIIEAMKLMNEIEADQSGTIAEILVEDGKPVSVDMPLFVIAP